MSGKDYWKIATKVHSARLRTFVWTPDREIWGKPDYWPSRNEIPPIGELFYEDCDGFETACYYDLEDMGEYPLSVICNIRRGVPSTCHAVCSLKGYILDNRYRRVWHWTQLDYEWIMAGRHGGKWHRIIGTERR